MINIPGYKTWATNDVITASDMNELHTDPLSSDVTAAETTTSTSYGDLTTSGPAVTKTLVNGQKVLVTVSARIDTPSVSVTGGFMSFAVSGATTLAASDSNAAFVLSNGTVDIGVMTERTTVFTATAGGSHTFTAKYKTAAGSTHTFRTRRIVVKPF